MARQQTTLEADRAKAAVRSFAGGPEGFRWHLRAMAAAAVALVLINIAIDPEHLWVVPVVVGWIALLIVHAFLVRTGSARALKAGFEASFAGMRNRVNAAVLGALARDAQAGPSPDEGLRVPPVGFTPARQAMVDPEPTSGWAGETAAGGSRQGAVTPHGNAKAGLPDAVLALWGPTIQAAGPSVADRYAGWRWSPAGPAPIAHQAAAFGSVGPANAASPPAAAARFDAMADGRAPVSLLAHEAATDSTLAGD